MRVRILLCLLAVLLGAASCGEKSNDPPAVDPGVVTIRVTNAQGDSLPDELVQIYQRGGDEELYLEFTDENGRARFTEVVPGTYVASVTAGDSLAKAFTVNVTTTDTEWPMVVEPGGWLRGRARLAGQSDHRGTLVSCFEVATAGAFTDSLGDYRVGPVPVGTWRLFAYNATLVRVGSDTITVSAPGENVAVDTLTLLPMAVPEPRLLERGRRALEARVARSRGR